MAVIVREKSFYRDLLLLSLPIMAQGLISFGINFTDNLMVGTLGESAVAGVHLGGQIQGFLTMLVAGIEGAILVLAAQYWGRKDVKSIKTIIAIGTRISLGCGLVFCAVSFFAAEPILRLLTPYDDIITQGVQYLRIISFSFLCFSISQILISSLRSVEVVRIGMYMTIISFVCNVFLNWVFIFGNLGLAPMGVAGAALATLICRIIEMAVMLVYVLAIERRLHMKLKEFLWHDKTLLKDLLRYGLPIIGGQVVWSINMLAQSAIVGRMSTEATAAVSISNQLFSLVYVGMGGFSAAVGIITGRTVGAGEFEKMKTYAKTIQLLFAGIGLLCGGLIFTTKELFVSAYSSMSPATVDLTLQFLTILSITAVGTSYQGASLAGLVKAGGDTSFVFINDTIFVFLVVLPSAAIALFHFNAAPWIVFLCLKSDQILKCFVAVIKINRFNWMKNLTRDFSDKEAPTAIE